MAFSEEFFGVADKFLFHWRFKVLLLGVCILPVRMFINCTLVSCNESDLNSSLLNTFWPQLKVTSSSSSFFRLGLAELAMFKEFQ